MSRSSISSMGRTERLESWSRVIVITDFIICGLATIGLLILMCLPQYFRDFVFRLIDEMDYDAARKEEMKPFYEHVLIPILLAGMAAIILFHFAMTLVLSFGVTKPNLSKLRGWIIVQIGLSMLTTLALFIVIVRYPQFILGFIPFILFQVYRFGSFVLVFKYQQALIAEDERYNRRYQLAGTNSPSSSPSPGSRRRVIVMAPPVRRVYYQQQLQPAVVQPIRRKEIITDV